MSIMKSNVIQQILKDKLHYSPQNQVVSVFASTNIALCKYWGKRNQELNLPITSSLSIALAEKGTHTELRANEGEHDIVVHNGETLDLDSPFCKRLVAFLDLFRGEKKFYLHINIQSNIPIAAGLASSASGFAALVKGLNELFKWGLSDQELSILARLGSGSASRSIWSGFVEWHAGKREDGMDSYAEPLANIWNDLCIGLLIFSKKEKPISSREAMRRTVETSLFYKLWPEKVANDLITLKEAIQQQDFHQLGRTAESNAIAMHATMLNAWPPVQYAIPETVSAMQTIWQLRQEGLPIYFTQDAGPNLKLLFLKNDKETVCSQFPNIELVYPFGKK